MRTINLNRAISPSWQWPTIITLSGIAAELFQFIDTAAPLRPIVVLSFLLICPGMAYVQLLNLDDPLHRFVVALALSIAIDLLVAATVLYSGYWDTRAILSILVFISQVGVFWHIYLWYKPRIVTPTKPTTLELG